MFNYLAKLARRLARLGGVVVAVVAGGACSGTDALSPDRVEQLTGDPPVAAVVLTPSADSTLVGATTRFIATPQDSAGKDLPGRPVLWTSADGSVATVDSAGVVTGMAPGTTTITASSEGKSAQGTVAVLSEPVAAVVVSPDSDSIAVGSTSQLTASAVDGAGRPLADRPIAWTTADAAVATVSDSGLVSGVAEGTARIAATSEGRSDTAVIHVVPVPVAAVTVSPTSVGLGQGETAQLTAVARDASGSTLSGRSFTWTSRAPAVATVSSSGLVTGVAVGATWVVATSEGQSDSARVTVTAAPVPVASVDVSPNADTVEVGSTAQLTAVARDASGSTLSGRSFTWTSRAPAVATVSSSGLVTGVAAGATWVVATSEGQSDSARVTVTAAPVPVASVDVSPNADTVEAGSTAQLTAVARDASGSTLSGRSFTWTSRTPAVATVSSSGLVAGVAVGATWVVAASEGRSDSARITVTPVPVASVTVAPGSASLAEGGAVQLTATTRDASGGILTGRSITWTSSASGIATVSGGGLVTGVAAGTATITATSEGRTGSATITVTAPPPPPTGCDATGSGVCRYVDAAGGNDANSGTSAQPFRTLQRAANAVNPGDVVIVRNGVYTGGATVVSLTRSGTASNWIVFRAETKWGAVIDGQSSSSTGGVNISGSYLRVQGFEVRGTNRYGIEAYGGRDVQVAQNHIHDIGKVCSSSSGGIVGVNAYVSNLVIEQNLIHDIGRYAAGENGCNPSNTYWQNHDHGIYNGEGDNVVIRNNVFYNLSHGWAIQRYNGSGIVTSNLAILNNTFVGANPYRDGQIIIATATTNLQIVNNIFYQPRTAGVFFDGIGLTGTVSNNLSYGASLSTGITLAVVFTNNLVNQDPRLVNPGAGDFHLQSGSPAIGAGLLLSNLLNDFAGLTRPAGTAPDIGAYQHQ